MNEEKKPKLVQEIPAIKNGTVLDHIPSARVHSIVSILNLKDETTTIGMNLSSKKFGNKAIIKVSNRFLDENEVNRISILAPDATLNRIKDYEVVEKSCLKIQDKIEGIIRCSNPNCITNQNPVSTRFRLTNQSPLKVKCAFCERTMNEDDVNSHLI